MKNRLKKVILKEKSGNKNKKMAEDNKRERMRDVDGRKRSLAASLSFLVYSSAWS